MRTFSAVAEKCDEYNRRARIGIPRASPTRAAARALIARLAQCYLKRYHAVCLAGIGATFAMAGSGAHAGRAVLARSGNLVIQE